MPYRVQIVCFLLLGCLTQGVMAAATLSNTIVGSKHDLSISNYYGLDVAFGVTPSDQICVFCHTPHGANIDLDNDGSNDPDDAVRPSAPLWNRKITNTSLASSFTPYGSSPGYQSATLNSTLVKGSWVPSPLSLVCLSCHDSALANSGSRGIVAISPNDTHDLFSVPNRAGADTPNCGACHPDGGTAGVPGTWWQIGPDMSDDHPVSIPYPPSYSGWTDDFYPPANANGWTGIKLYKGRVECPSCHNPHNPGEIVYEDGPAKYAPFLRETLDGSTLCVTCHKK